ncbi:MAG: sodium:solute symporter, partial [Bacteroidales bacterium]|nr:sodium:solute symporter [Bacteroidales bacterium]
FGFSDTFKSVFNSNYFDIVVTDIHAKNHYLKQFFSGTFIAIVMTGLDQDMMQKNLSCRTLRESQKNMMTFSIVLIFVNFLFLFLGALLYFYTDMKGLNLSELIGNTSDNLFPALSLQYLGILAGLTFIIGLISAAYSSADGALTALTTSFSLDILNLRNKNYDEKRIKRIRYIVHLSFSFLMLCAIIFYKLINNDAIINKLFTIAGYTYGPLLGLFSFGLFFKRKVRDALVPVVCIASPVICYILSSNSKIWWGYEFGFELLMLNGFLTFVGLLLLSKRQN